MLDETLERFLDHAERPVGGAGDDVRQRVLAPAGGRPGPVLAGSGLVLGESAAVLLERVL